MRWLPVALALLLAPALVAAEPAQPVRQCLEPGCVIVKDDDGDGRHDWANVALAVDELLVVNANLNRTILLWEVDVTDEELGGEAVEEAKHEAGEAIGADPRVVTLSMVGSANLTSRDGSPGFHDADVLVAILLMDHETGQQEAVVWRYARAYDSNGDDVPDGVQTLP